MIDDHGYPLIEAGSRPADLSYSDAVAIARAQPPHHVLLGPAPCHSCGAWVEWAGVEWLALGTDQEHECEPFLQGLREHAWYELAQGWQGEVARVSARRIRHIKAGTGLRQAHLEPLVPELPPLPWRWVLAVLVVAALLVAGAKLGALPWS